MAAPNKEAAGDWHRATAQEITQRRQDTKILRILETLRSGRSLNRFDAEILGDHALNSTIARLRVRRADRRRVGAGPTRSASRRA